MDRYEKFFNINRGDLAVLLYLQMIETERDRDKFEILYREYRNLMYRITFGILHNQEDAEDAVHQAFVSILEHLNKISNPTDSSAKSFCATCARNKALDIYRKNQHNEYIGFDQLQISVESDFPDGSLEAAIAALPDLYKDVILLRYDNGFSVQEIAEILNIEPGAVRKRITRAKSKLEEYLIREGFIL